MTQVRSRLVVPGAVLAAAGFVALLAGLTQAGLLTAVLADFGAIGLGWGTLLEAFVGGWAATHLEDFAQLISASGRAAPMADSTRVTLAAGAAAWVAGWALLSRGLTPEPEAAVAPSEAVGAPLSPRLALYRDFHWGTLLAYGLGILFAELSLLVSYTLLVGQGAAADAGAPSTGMSPVGAFVTAGLLASLVAFACGALGAANSKRLSTPEATIALLYFGLPVPLLLTLLHSVPSLMLSFGYRLREITFLASQLGEQRVQVGYWLAFIGLCIALVLGLISGFVATSSGKVDLGLKYELFVASRHLSIFRPRLLLGTMAVLLFGLIPPLVLYAIIRAAESAVERTRIRKLGLKDPIAAAAAINALKLQELTPTALMTSLSVIGVGFGVMALIIVLSVMSGFEDDLQQKILGTNSHGVVLKYSDPMPEFPEVMEKIRKVPGVAGMTPFILNEVMVSSEGNLAGSMIKGIDPGTVASVTDLPKYLQPGGNLDWLNHPERITARRLAPLNKPALDERGALDDGVFDAPKPKTDEAQLDRDPLIDTGGEGMAVVLPGIIVGRELAAQLRVVVGDRLNVVSPLGGELGPQGPMPKSRPFRVAGIFYSGMFEYDSKFVYIHLSEAQSFFGIKGATGIELKVDDVDDARRIVRRVHDTLGGFPYRTRDWGEMNKNLFSALRLEKLVMGIILTTIVLIACLLIVATVIMLVLEKRKEIAVLKALGVSDGGVVKIFLAEGLQIGVAGGLLGLVAGLAWCLFIEKVGIKLDPQVYYIPALPVRIEPFQTVLSVVIAVLLTFVGSIYPAMKASQVEPVDGLKSE